jgi:hypothetical protein
MIHKILRMQRFERHQENKKYNRWHLTSQFIEPRKRIRLVISSKSSSSSSSPILYVIASTSITIGSLLLFRAALGLRSSDSSSAMVVVRSMTSFDESVKRFGIFILSQEVTIGSTTTTKILFCQHNYDGAVKYGTRSTQSSSDFRFGLSLQQRL